MDTCTTVQITKESSTRLRAVSGLLGMKVRDAAEEAVRDWIKRKAAEALDKAQTIS